jgi:hypothetical protein
MPFQWAACTGLMANCKNDTGAGNETMLIAAISLATDATLLADDRY